MIGFFRRIRKKLADDNQFLKYSRYAVGEIVLVMVGILLALQVNNWNEVRKDRLFEVKMLSEIHKALNNDIRGFEGLIGRMERLDSVTISFAKKIHDRSFNKDSFSVKYDFALNLLYTGIQYQYNRGPYEALKASGIDKISNDSLRNELIKLYDFTFPRNMEITKRNDRHYDKQIEKVKSFVGKAEIVFERGELNFTRTVNQDKLNNQNFINLLEEINSRAKRVGGSLKYIVPKMIEIRNQIELEVGV